MAYYPYGSPEYYQQLQQANPYADTVGSIYGGQSQEDMLAQQARNWQNEQFTQGPPDRNKVNQDVLAGFQSEIDALNSYYSQAKFNVMRQQQEIAQRQQGGQRAMLAGAGMLGQVSGFGQQEELKQANLAQQNAAVGQVEAEQMMNVNALKGKARELAAQEYKDKYEAYSKRAEDIIAWGEGKEERDTAKVQKYVKQAMANNVDLSSYADLKKDAIAMGVDTKAITAEYNTQKGLLEEAQKAQELELEKTLTGIDYQKAQTEKIKYEMANPDIKTTIQEINGRMIMFNAQTGQTIKDLGPITPKEVSGTGVGGTSVSKDAQAKIDDSNYVISQMDKLTQLWNNVPDKYKGYFQGRASTLIGSKSYAKEVAEFESAKSLVGMALTRLFEKGVISDKDREFYLSQMPNLTQSTTEVVKTSADAIKEQLKQKVKALQGNVESTINNDPLGIR